MRPTTQEFYWNCTRLPAALQEEERGGVSGEYFKTWIASLFAAWGEYSTAAYLTKRKATDTTKPRASRVSMEQHIKQFVRSLSQSAGPIAKAQTGNVAAKRNRMFQSQTGDETIISSPVKFYYSGKSGKKGSGSTHVPLSLATASARLCAIISPGTTGGISACFTISSRLACSSSTTST